MPAIPVMRDSLFQSGAPFVFRVPGRSRIEIDDLIAVHARPSSFHFSASMAEGFARAVGGRAVTEVDDER
jgi:hypothetical protein